MVRIPARAHVLHSMSNQALPWWKALAELVDNSFDAGAYRVTIEMAGRTLIVSDDGRGATKETMSTATAVKKLSDIDTSTIASICVRSANSKRAHAYTSYHDIADLRTIHGAMELIWDGAYGCYVMTKIGGKVATMMVYVNREPAE
jgi:hypothetical protein